MYWRWVFFIAFGGTAIALSVCIYVVCYEASFGGSQIDQCYVELETVCAYNAHMIRDDFQSQYFCECERACDAAHGYDLCNNTTERVAKPSSP